MSETTQETTTQVTAAPLPAIPPSHHLATLISDLLTLDLDTPTGRIAAKAKVHQAARVIATFCSPAGGYAARPDGDDPFAALDFDGAFRLPWHIRARIAVRRVIDAAVCFVVGHRWETTDGTSWTDYGWEYDASTDCARCGVSVRQPSRLTLPERWLAWREGQRHG